MNGDCFRPARSAVPAALFYLVAIIVGAGAFASLAGAQDDADRVGAIRGRVSDGATSAPVEGVTVTVVWQTKTDGSEPRQKVQTTNANSLTFHIASSSDSNHTYNVTSGSFSGTSHHAPNHENGPMAGSITNGCVGYRIQTKTGQSGTGTWSETDYGYKGGFPSPVR